MDVGARIKHFRMAKGISVNKLADNSGISQSYLRDIELGNKENPSIAVIENICSALGISLCEFFSDETKGLFSQSKLVQTIYLLSPAQQNLLEQFLTSLMIMPPARPNETAEDDE